MASAKESVLDFVKQNPDKTAGDIVAGVEASETTVRKHLAALVKDGTVVKDGSNGTATFAAKAKKTAGKAKDPDALSGRGNTEAAQRRDALVLERIKTHSGSVKDLADGTELTTSLVYLSIYRLKRDGKIERVRTGSRVPEYVLQGTAPTP